MSDQRSAKGNPAHKRMSNAARKAKMARSFAAGLTRRAQRNRAQEEAHKRNEEGRAAHGCLTPWETACAARRERRQHKRPQAA